MHNYGSNHRNFLQWSIKKVLGKYAPTIKLKILDQWKLGFVLKHIALQQCKKNETRLEITMKMMQQNFSTNKIFEQNIF